MSVFQFPESQDSSADLQVWNNAAFDKAGENSEDLTASRQSWGSLKSIFANPQASFDSDSDKENQSLVLENNIQISPVTKPFMPHNTWEESITEGASKKGLDEIDKEIEEIESQISRLKSRLEDLRLEKSQMSIKALERRGRVVPAKFMDPITIGKDKKMGEHVSSMSSRPKVQRRGISLGPVEIISGGGRRGVMSMGPSEIFGAIKSKQQISGKQEMVTPIQSRRKSCFLKLQDIDEKKAVVVKERGKSSSVSPNLRKVALKSQVATSRQAMTTIASKKTYPIIHSVQPKKLFREGENSVPASSNKPPSLRPGRVVASRYNQTPTQATVMRKRSLPENDNGFSQKLDNKRPLSVGKTRAGNGNLVSEIRVKKHWEIPREIFLHGSAEAEEEMSIGAGHDLLPRIKVAQCMRESPRDSGPAKKVVELIGKKSFFWNEDLEVEPSVCQALTYAEEDDEGEEFSFRAYN